jgi:glycosyltransferase involved in cell wall biosynthesis
MSEAPLSPKISVIVPCYNEERTIGLLLNAIANQTVPLNELEVVIADGLSTDRTREEIKAFQLTTPSLNIRVIDNPKRIIPAALNAAIEHSRGAILIRLDAHCMPYPDYIERCVSALELGRGENVGGVWEIKAFSSQGNPPSAIARSIAIAAAHPLGVGDAYYRFATQAQAVDTVPFGAFRRSLIDRIGGFDETLLTNEDYEFNVRVKQSGGEIWLDPKIRTVYFARPNLCALSRQYWRYGFWKARMLHRYSKTIRWRQALPPVFTAALLALTALCPWVPLARWLVCVQLGLYFLILLMAAIPIMVSKKDPFILLGFPTSVAAMHLCWGAGFLTSLFSPVQNQEKRR